MDSQNPTTIDTDYVRQRITELRKIKGVSEHQMSIDLGKSRSYIQNIIAGRSMPSWTEFFTICEYFKVQPKHFFDSMEDDPALMTEILERVRKLDSGGRVTILNVLVYMLKGEKEF